MLTGRAAPRIAIERIPYEPDRWRDVVAARSEAEVFHSPAWLAYLAETQGIEIVVASVHQDGALIGHFVGGLTRRFGLRILGSPMSGWGTPRMGFLLDPVADRPAAARALRRFAFRDLGCVHVELGDESLTPAGATTAGYAVESGRTFLVDLRRPEDEILAAMHPRTRTYVRQGPRRGLVAERARRDEDFAAEYHAQLTEVFARQGLAPTYGVERVRSLIRHLEPTGQLLLLRIRDADGESLATLVAVGNASRAVLWGAAMRRGRGGAHPAELLHWEAIRDWRERGTALYDFGGGGDYKVKFGGVETPSRRYLAYRLGVLGHGRRAARAFFRLRQTRPRPGRQPGAAEAAAP